jgi:hypothetical protein
MVTTDDDDLGTTNIMEHSINTGSSKQLKQPPVKEMHRFQ